MVENLKLLGIMLFLVGLLSLGIYTQVKRVQACQIVTGFGPVTCFLISGSGGRK